MVAWFSGKITMKHTLGRGFDARYDDKFDLIFHATYGKLREIGVTAFGVPTHQLPCS